MVSEGRRMGDLEAMAVMGGGGKEMVAVGGICPAELGGEGGSVCSRRMRSVNLFATYIPLRICFPLHLSINEANSVFLTTNGTIESGTKPFDSRCPPTHHLEAATSSNNDKRLRLDLPSAVIEMYEAYVEGRVALEKASAFLQGYVPGSA